MFLAADVDQAENHAIGLLRDYRVDPVTANRTRPGHRYDHPESGVMRGRLHPRRDARRPRTVQAVDYQVDRAARNGRRRRITAAHIMVTVECFFDPITRFPADILAPVEH